MASASMELVPTSALVRNIKLSLCGGALPAIMQNIALRCISGETSFLGTLYSGWLGMMGEWNLSLLQEDPFETSEDVMRCIGFIHEISFFGGNDINIHRSLSIAGTSLQTLREVRFGEKREILSLLPRHVKSPSPPLPTSLEEVKASPSKVVELPSEKAKETEEIPPPKAAEIFAPKVEEKKIIKKRVAPTSYAGKAASSSSPPKSEVFSVVKPNSQPKNRKIVTASGSSSSNPKKCFFGRSCCNYHLLQQNVKPSEIKAKLGPKYCEYSHIFEEDDVLPGAFRAYGRCVARFNSDKERKEHMKTCKYWHEEEMDLLRDFECPQKVFLGKCTSYKCLLCSLQEEKNYEEDDSSMTTPQQSFSLLAVDFPLPGEK